MNRREFLFKGTVFVAASATGLLLPDVAAAQASDFWTKDRTIDVLRAQTGERARVKFFANGEYTKEGYRQLCYMMRDVRDKNTMVSVDIGLFNLIFGVQEWARNVGVRDPFYTLTSGYRTRAHNSSIEGAARNSLHVQARASDGKFRGIDPNTLAQMAKYYQAGGVGLYDNFVHLDTGRVRYWRGNY